MWLVDFCGKHTQKKTNSPHISVPFARSGTFLAVTIFVVGWFSACSPARYAAHRPAVPVPAGFYEQHSRLLGIPLSGREDPRLIAEAASWMGTPYRFGGASRAGADCSGFVWSVYRNAFGMDVPRTTAEQVRQSRRIRHRNLREGDMVFFRTARRRKITHSGIYLGNNKFIHASSSRGVIVSDLAEPYYAWTFIHGGRFR